MFACSFLAVFLIFSEFPCRFPFILQVPPPRNDRRMKLSNTMAELPIGSLRRASLRKRTLTIDTTVTSHLQSITAGYVGSWHNPIVRIMCTPCLRLPHGEHTAI